MQVTLQRKPGFVGILVRCIVLGIVYALVSGLVTLLLGPMSRLQPTPDSFLVWFISGTALCLALAPFIVHSGWSRWKTVLAAWAVIVFVRAFGLGIEGALFKPAQADVALLNAGLGIIVGFLMSWLAVLLLMPAEAETSTQPEKKRSWWGWAWRILLVGAAYFVFYAVFGAANALLYTRPFYENNPQYGLTLPPAGLIFSALLIRGPLFGLGAFFVARSAILPEKRKGIWLGLLLFVLGGFGPYLEATFRTMPLGFNLATLLELFLQNFSTGLVAARLYR